MNRNPQTRSASVVLLTAITGFVNYKTAQGLSQRSVDSYKRILEQWAEYSGIKRSRNSLIVTLILIWSI